MNETATRSRESTTARDIAPDAATLEAHLATSDALFKSEVTQTRMNAWVKAGGVHAGLFADLVFWGIRWKKSLGRPLTPKLADAFVVRHLGHFKKVRLEGGRFEVIDATFPYPEPDKHDGPTNAEYYQVSVMAHSPLDQLSTFSVELAPHVAWPATDLFHRGLFVFTPAEQTLLKGSGLVVLKTVEVTREPYRVRPA